MLIDTTTEIMHQAREDMQEAEDALNVIIGRLKGQELNDLLYRAVTDLHSTIGTL